MRQEHGASLELSLLLLLPMKASGLLLAPPMASNYGEREQLVLIDSPGSISKDFDVLLYFGCL